ncbi:hypothetical protein [Paenibacillus tarimensis]|uniref:hypothetical protein n=1 Tax=Paenibacillus tarimensis TaxID=416012 RepID=UPI001F33A137|nr:hypothetical protein [Paenibacillus tarimensis]MCF2945928.1 hypothetical protein [Paenibacillus tarimensis]
MDKLLLLLLFSVVWIMVHTLQIDEEMAMRTLFEGKHAVNRAAHAAAQQLDPLALSRGEIRIDPRAAAEAGALYLQGNLKIDETGMPLRGSKLRERAELLLFKVVDGDESFPYHYRNEAFNYEVTLQRPGVIMIVRLRNPNVFRMLEPIEWDIKGAAEVVY